MGSKVHRNTVVGVSQHVGELVAKAAVPNAEVIAEAQRARPGWRLSRRFRQQASQDFRGARQQVREVIGFGVDLSTQRPGLRDQTLQVGAVKRGADLLMVTPCNALGNGSIFGNCRIDVTGDHALGKIWRDRADVALGRQHDGRVLRARLVVRAHQVRDVARELVARHVVEQQRDRTKPLTQTNARLAVNWPEQIIFSKPNIERAAIRVNSVLPPLERPNSTA